VRYGPCKVCKDRSLSRTVWTSLDVSMDERAAGRNHSIRSHQLPRMAAGGPLGGSFASSPTVTNDDSDHRRAFSQTVPFEHELMTRSMREESCGRSDNFDGADTPVGVRSSSAHSRIERIQRRSSPPQLPPLSRQLDADAARRGPPRLEGDDTAGAASHKNQGGVDGVRRALQLQRIGSCVSSLGPAAAATTAKPPSSGFMYWLSELEERVEERLLHDARKRFTVAGSSLHLEEFRRWLQNASLKADENLWQLVRKLQMRTWLLVVSRKRRTRISESICRSYDWIPHLPTEVRHRIEAYVGGRHMWGPLTASQARAVSESASRPLKRCEEILRAAALAALIARYVHPMIATAAEAGLMYCFTEIPTDDVTLRAIFEGSGSDAYSGIGLLLAAHLAIDGFEVELLYHDPEYGLWRGFWVEKCNRLRLTLIW